MPTWRPATEKTSPPDPARSSDLIEDIMGRQERLETLADRLPLLEQSGGVEEGLAAPVVVINVTDEERDGAEALVQALECLEILRHEPRLEDKILWRITGDRQFGSQDQFGASGRESLVGGEDLFTVPTKIPDSEIDLRDADPHASLAG